MKRVMIIGGSGAGKSTLARAVATKLDLPVHHLDKFQFLPGWVERDPKLRGMMIAQAARTDRWVMDGNYAASWAPRLARADIVVWLDFPLWLRIGRVLRRTWRHRGVLRPDLPDACPEQFNPGTFGFLRFIIADTRTFEAKVERWLIPEGVPVVRLKTDRAVAAWLKSA